MANLPSNSLKQEELVGNFQVDDPSNDSFKLNQGIEYPGDLSEFYSAPDEEVQVLEEDQVEEAQVADDVQEESLSGIEQESQESAVPAEEPQESVWNAFQDNFEEEELVGKIEPFGEDELEDELVGKIEPFGEDEPDDELVGKIEPFGEDEPDDELVGKIDPFGEGDTEEESAETLIAEQSAIEEELDEIAIDKAFQGMQSEESEDIDLGQIAEDEIDLLGDDLRKIIENDLKRSKKVKSKKEQPTVPKELSEEEIKEKIESFKPVDDLAKSQVFNFDDIEAEHPSKVGQKAIPDDSAIEEEPKKAKIKEKPEKKPKVKKIKTKRAIPVLLVLSKIRWALPVAALIAGIVLLIYFYPNLIRDVKNIFTSSDSLQVKDISQIDTISQKEQDKIETQQKDTSDLAQKTEIDSLQKDIDSSVAIKEDEKIEKELEAKPEQPIIVQEVKKPETNQTKPQRKKAALEISKRKETPPPRATSIKKKTTERSIAKQSPKIIPEKKELATIEDNKTDELTSKVISNAVYSVEVYSTLSKEDAEDWQRKLQKRGIKAFIVKHYQRDLVWYKVRFGAFSSKSEASDEARNLGFFTFWIDRIK
ncbi:MAG: hypothetical protein GX121_05545 [Ignavibacteria bacterium]|nr:hypothetical protein [Ignavibacteria bacterium]